jgi:hypothetical protein
MLNPEQNPPTAEQKKSPGNLNMILKTVNTIKNIVYDV